MSKPISIQNLPEFKEDFLAQKPEILTQALNLLENLLRSNASDEKLVRISSELSEILSDEKNYEKIKSAKNLDELLNTLESLNKSDKMLKIYLKQSLEQAYPTLAQKSFL